MPFASTPTFSAKPRLGRNRVCVIAKGQVEIPSDYSGVLYIPLDELGAWMTALDKELKSVVS